jgi:hypothetical protein
MVGHWHAGWRVGCCLIALLCCLEHEAQFEWLLHYTTVLVYCREALHQ